MLVININHIKADLVTIQDIDIVIVGVSIVDAVIQAFLKWDSHLIVFSS